MRRTRGEVIGEQDTRGRVLRAAAELFGTRGYAATSISAIRKASGVLPSSIYWEFGSKEGLLAAVLEDFTKRWLEESSLVLHRLVRERAGSNADLLNPYFDYMAETLADRPEWLRLTFLVAVERRDADERSLEIIRTSRQRAAEGLARFFSAAGLVGPDADSSAARDAARLAIACFDGAVVAAQIDADAADLRRMFELLRAGIAAASRSRRDEDPKGTTTRN